MFIIVVWMLLVHAVTVKTCPPLPQLRHGTVSCTKNDFSYETKCHFMCDAGYVLVGSKTRTCFAIAHWDGIEPTCRGMSSLLICGCGLPSVELFLVKVSV